MSTLHLVFSPSGALRCRAAGITDPIVLIGDGVYALTTTTFEPSAKAVDDDLKARGIDGAAETISVDDLVRLTIESERTVSWR